MVWEGGGREPAPYPIHVQSTFAPNSLTTFCHFTVSAPMCRVNDEYWEHLDANDLEKLLARIDELAASYRARRKQP